MRALFLCMNFRFPGQYADAETGLNYNGPRFYDSNRGGFDQPDPSGFDGGIDLYVYGLNDPLMYIDPSGLCPGDGQDGEQGRYQNCNQTQQSGDGWLTKLRNKALMNACKKVIDQSCKEGTPYSCCLADYKECSGGSVPGMPPESPQDAPKLLQCQNKFDQCMTTGGQ
jgi:RHS repeat-associated protein